MTEKNIAIIVKKKKRQNWWKTPLAQMCWYYRSMSFCSVLEFVPMYYWKKVELRNSTFWNVGEKLGFLFSIWGTWESWAISCLGWHIFWYSQLKKNLFFSFKWRQPEVSTINSLGVMNFWIFFYFFAFSQKSIFFIDPIFSVLCNNREE